MEFLVGEIVRCAENFLQSIVGGVGSSRRIIVDIVENAEEQCRRGRGVNVEKDGGTDVDDDANDQHGKPREMQTDRLVHLVENVRRHNTGTNLKIGRAFRRRLTDATWEKTLP